MVFHTPKRGKGQLLLRGQVNPLLHNLVFGDIDGNALRRNIPTREMIAVKENVVAANGHFFKNRHSAGVGYRKTHRSGWAARTDFSQVNLNTAQWISSPEHLYAQRAEILNAGF